MAASPASINRRSAAMPGMAAARTRDGRRRQLQHIPTQRDPPPSARHARRHRQPGFPRARFRVSSPAAVLATIPAQHQGRSTLTSTDRQRCVSDRDFLARRKPAESDTLAQHMQRTGADRRSSQCRSSHRRIRHRDYVQTPQRCGHAACGKGATRQQADFGSQSARSRVPVCACRGPWLRMPARRSDAPHPARPHRRDRPLPATDPRR